MKKIFVLSLAIAGLVLAGCNKETVPAAPATEGQVVTITASTTDVATKMSSSATTGKFTWTTGDVIGVWTGSELTPFTLDKSYNGLGYGKFTGTIPAGGAIDENSYAVYPYSGMTATATEVALPDLGWNDYPTRSYFLFSNQANINEDGTVSGFTFAHVTAYFRVTLTNVPKSAKSIFYESWCPNKSVDLLSYSLAGGSIDVSTGAFTPEVCDWRIIQIPENSGSFTLILPIAPGAFGNAKFRLQLKDAADAEMAADKYNYSGFLDVNASAGDYYVFPDIVCPNEAEADDSGSGVNDGIEDAVVKNQDEDGFWRIG